MNRINFVQIDDGHKPYRKLQKITGKKYIHEAMFEIKTNDICNKCLYN